MMSVVRGLTCVSLIDWMNECQGVMCRYVCSERVNKCESDWLIEWMNVRVYCVMTSVVRGLTNVYEWMNVRVYCVVMSVVRGLTNVYEWMNVRVYCVVTSVVRGLTNVYEWMNVRVYFVKCHWWDRSLTGGHRRQRIRWKDALSTLLLVNVATFYNDIISALCLNTCKTCIYV